MQQLLENYPYATEAVREWFIKQMVDSFKDEEVPQGFKDFMREQGVPNDTLVKLVGSNPRSLFDVFDENSLFIEMMYMEHKFHYTVSNGEEILIANIETYTKRRDCEAAAVAEAFKILNEKLCPQQTQS